MASRREQLNAHTFAKKRMLASFLSPSPSGSEETAPRPMRAVVPGLVIGVVVMAGFGAYGMFKPKAPDGWDDPETNVIIASDSTTRYVVLKTHGKDPQLHPVLNMASAKLLVKPGEGKVIKVDESILDNGDIPHGATIGIPYAPDRLPSDAEAGSAKQWVVCEQPVDSAHSSGNSNVQRATFVFSDRDRHRTAGKNRLHGGDLLYVKNGKNHYVVDAKGTKYEVDTTQPALLTSLVGTRKAQDVSAEWLATLHQGDPIKTPVVPNAGTVANIQGTLPAEAKKVGMVLSADNGGTLQHYVVLPDRVAPVSDFVAKLLLGSQDLVKLGQHGQASEQSSGGFVAGKEFAGKDAYTWPTAAPHAVGGSSDPDGRRTFCSMLNGMKGKQADGTLLGTWAGEDFPADLPSGSSSGYVTPGSGQLFRQFSGNDTKSGSLFLVTDTGLRYALSGNGDGSQDDSGIGTDKKSTSQQQEADKNARNLLGYEHTEEAVIPDVWGSLLPTGPTLSRGDANQPQGS